MEHVESQRGLHQTIYKVREDIQALKYNAAIATLMTYLNTLEAKEQLAPDASQDEAIALATQLESVQRYINEQEVRRVVYVPGQVLNLVI